MCSRHRLKVRRDNARDHSSLSLAVEMTACGTMQVMGDETENGATDTPGRLPNAVRAIVERRKVVEYLLNPEHDQGASKADFFSRFGFSADCWQDLALAIVGHAVKNPATLDTIGQYGEEWVVVGPLTCPDGREPVVKSIWQLSSRLGIPRLITAYRFRR